MADTLDEDSNQGPAPFEVLLQDSELNYINQLLPKGYTLTLSSRIPKTSKPPAPKPSEPPADSRDDPLAKRVARPPKDRAPPPAFIAQPKTVPAKPSTDLLKKCQRVLGLIQKHRSAEPFLYPVDPVALGIPDYPTIVKEPMDLSTVEKKLRQGQYASVQQFAADVRKIWSNAILYNPKTSPIYELTLVMSEYFEKLYREIEDTPAVIDTLPKQISAVDKKLEAVKSKSGNRDLSRLPMTLEEKRVLTNLIKTLPTEHLTGVCEIILEECPELRHKSELAFDISKLSEIALRRLEKFVKSKHLNFSSKLNEKPSIKPDNRGPYTTEVSASKQAQPSSTQKNAPPAPAHQSNGYNNASGSKRKNSDEDDIPAERGSDSSFFTDMESEEANG